MEEFGAIIAALQAEDPRFKAKVTLNFTRRGYEIDPKHPLVLKLVESIRANLGEEPTLKGSSGWMDSAVLGGKGIPTAIYGIGGYGGHDLVEWSSVSALVRYSNMVADFLVKVCGAET